MKDKEKSTDELTLNDSNTIEYSSCVTLVGLDCKYCGERVEGMSTDEVILNIIYHVHEKHGSRSLEAVNL